MPPNFQFEFFYFTKPRIPVGLGTASNDLQANAQVLLDTGAEISLFDMRLAVELGIDFRNAPSIRVHGVTVDSIEVLLATVEVRLLGLSELAAVVEVGFVEALLQTAENIIGLDVLEHFEFGLSHSQRLGYLGRSTAAQRV